MAASCGSGLPKRFRANLNVIPKPGALLWDAFWALKRGRRGPWRPFHVMTAAMAALAEPSRAAMAELKSLARRGRAEEAQQLLHGMRAAQLQPDRFHYNAALGAFRPKGRWQSAAALLEQMEADMEPSLVSLNSLLGAMAASTSVWQRAGLVLDRSRHLRLPPDSFSCTDAMHACQRTRQWRRIVHLLLSLEGSKAELNMLNFNGAICNIAKDQWRVSVGLLQSMEWRHVPSDAALRAAARKGLPWAQALAAAEDAAALGHLSSGAGTWDRCLALLQRLGASRCHGAGVLTPDVSVDAWAAALSLVQVPRDLRRLHWHLAVRIAEMAAWQAQPVSQLSRFW
ncbi:unnamed protein product, partial [Effrenium voratum]